jgi:hypothetical protein
MTYRFADIRCAECAAAHTRAIALVIRRRAVAATAGESAYCRARRQRPVVPKVLEPYMPFEGPSLSLARRRPTVAAALALVVTAVPVAAAEAQSVARGTYECQQFSRASGTFMNKGTLTIVSGTSYRTSIGNGGRYAYRSATRRLTFTSGAYGKWRGVFEPKGTKGRNYHTIKIRLGTNASRPSRFCFRY